MTRAPLTLRALAFLIDLGWISASAAAAIRVLGATPYPSIESLLKLAAFAIPLWAAQIALLQGTLGQRALRLRYADRNGEPYSGTEALLPVLLSCVPGRPDAAALWRTGTLGSTRAATAALVVAASLLTDATLALMVFRSQPALQKGVLWNIAPFTPSADPFFRRTWITIPFYYAIGTWPKKFRGKPVFFVLPYQKGPPKQFPGKVHARWEMPQTQLTIEGPKTPPDLPPPGTLKGCVLGDPEAGSWGECLGVRRRAIARHVREMERLGGSDWRVRWFEVSNPALPEGERPRGIYLSATDGETVQERYILVNAQGSHQALMLTRPANKDGEEARMELELVIGALRVTESLDTGRAWINNELAQTKLDDLRHLRDTISFVSRLAEIQAMLISQVTVEPDNVNAYYHLGGLSLMLLKHAEDLRTTRTQIASTQTLLMLDEWTAAVTPMIKATLDYVRDINPEHPHAQRLQNLWIEAQKL